MGFIAAALGISSLVSALLPHKHEKKENLDIYYLGSVRISTYLPPRTTNMEGATLDAFRPLYLSTHGPSKRACFVSNASEGTDIDLYYGGGRYYFGEAGKLMSLSWHHQFQKFTEDNFADIDTQWKLHPVLFMEERQRPSEEEGKRSSEKEMRHRFAKWEIENSATKKSMAHQRIGDHNNLSSDEFVRLQVGPSAFRNIRAFQNAFHFPNYLVPCGTTKTHLVIKHDLNDRCDYLVNSSSASKNRQRQENAKEDFDPSTVDSPQGYIWTPDNHYYDPLYFSSTKESECTMSIPLMIQGRSSFDLKEEEKKMDASDFIVYGDTVFLTSVDNPFPQEWLSRITKVLPVHKAGILEQHRFVEKPSLFNLPEAVIQGLGTYSAQRKDEGEMKKTDAERRLFQRQLDDPGEAPAAGGERRRYYDNDL